MSVGRAGLALVPLVVLAMACGQGGGGGETATSRSSADGGVSAVDAGAATSATDTCDADLTTDPNNCGACGRTCRITNGEAGCEAGECTLARCEAGWFDADGNVDNGCELEDTCEPEAACTTACGSSGATACDRGTATCTPPAEVCNATDDDCDGSCDEGSLAGCRVAVHRSNGNGHLYTTDLAAASSAPFTLEANSYFHVYTASQPGLRPVFLCRKADGKYLLTTDTACELSPGAVIEGRLGFWSPTETCGAVPLYRLFHDATGNHFFTRSAPERDQAIANAGYRDEGIAGWVWPAP